MLNDKKVIIFDMDGTLIDSVGIWNEVDVTLIQRLCAGKQPLSTKVQEERDHILRRFSCSASPYMDYCGYLKKTYASTLSVGEIHSLRYEIAQNYLINIIDYKENADIFIRNLKAAGYILVIATTTRRNNMNIYRTQNRNIISKANIDDYFSLIYTREDTKKIKPDPEIYLRVMNELGVPAQKCLVFEDSLIGIEAAKNAGIESVAVYDKYSDAERDRINTLSDYQIDTYSQLLWN